jgi:hypothetical protein
MAIRFRLLRSLLVACCAAAIALAPAASAEPSKVDDSGGVPTVNGVPCVAGHLGTCLSFLQNRPPHADPIPRSKIGHSPTVRR